MAYETFRDLVDRAELDYAEQLAPNEATKTLIKHIRVNCIENELPLETISCNSLGANIEDYISGAESILQAGCPAEAELVLLAAAFLLPEAQSVVSRIAQLYEAQQRYAETVSFTKYLLKAKGQKDEATYQLSFALYMLGRSDEALEYLLPYYICDPSQRVSRLTGLILKSLGRAREAIEVLEAVAESNPSEIYTLQALVELYTELGMYQKCLNIFHGMPENIVDDNTKRHEAIIYRCMGEIDRSITKYAEIISDSNVSTDARWPQCFNFSIAGSKHIQDLLSTAQEYWSSSGFLDPDSIKPSKHLPVTTSRKIRIGFLTGDLGDHVVSRFLTPLLRCRSVDEVHILLLSTTRRFENKAEDIISMADGAISLQGLSITDARACIQAQDLDVIVETNGFTTNSGLQILGRRCAPIQCHYIGYHATTGLKTLDYFLGDSITTPNDFQWQYTERLVQVPQLWMAYDPKIEFPEALAKAKKDSPVFGAFSQVAKINSLTLQYWGAAMIAAPDSILVVKDRGVQCPTTRKRIEETLEQLGVNPDRIYFFGPVGSHLDHLDSYNAIDIALDTTPWSGATTAFEALGMGVPLVAICGDTTSGRMSTSVVSAAGKSHWIAHSKEDFARIAAELAENYQHLRKSKASMQREIRSGILFDEQRICRDFYLTIEQLMTELALGNKERFNLLESEVS